MYSYRCWLNTSLCDLCAVVFSGGGGVSQGWEVKFDAQLHVLVFVTFVLWFSVKGASGK